VAIARSNRIWLLLSLPLAVAAIWLTLAAVANWQRNQLIDQLTTQIIEGNRRGSLAAISALTSAPRPLLEPIVRAAASPNRTLAEGAQLAVSDLIDQWQLQTESRRNARAAADGLDELAAALDANRATFAPQDGPWITRTVGAMIRLANRTSPAAGLELTMHCESLMAAASHSHLAATSSVSPSPASPAASQTERAGAPGNSLSRPATNANSKIDVTPSGEPTDSTAAESAFSAPPQSAYQTIAASEASATDHPAATRSAAPQAGDGKARWSWPDADSGLNQGSTGDGGASGAARSRTGDSSPAGANFIETTPVSAESLKSVDSRSLLQRWLTANETTWPPLERELARRGLGKPNAEIARILFSDRVEDRIRLVHEILAAPGINTNAWLQLFTEDANADVRLAAITLMSTSNDPQLMEQAYQATLHDRDPRVADLAARLHDRRDNVERR
jgi:hypothetical protein